MEKNELTIFIILCISWLIAEIIERMNNRKK